MHKKKRLRPAPNLSSDFTNGNRKDMHRFGIICAVLRETEAPDILRTSKRLQPGSLGNPYLCSSKRISKQTN